MVLEVNIPLYETTYFKLTLPNVGNELNVEVWTFRTPKQFLVHVCSAIHVCKQMGLDSNFAKLEKAVKTVVPDTELTKRKLVQAHNSE